MAEGHADMVRRACRAWCEGDISVYREMYVPDVIAEGGGLWPEGDGPEQGADVVIATLESIMAAFERSELIPEAIHEDGEALVTEMLWRGVLPGVDTPIEQRLVSAYRFRDGLIAYQGWFTDLAQAAAAVGVELADGAPPQS